MKTLLIYDIYIDKLIIPLSATFKYTYHPSIGSVIGMLPPRELHGSGDEVCSLFTFSVGVHVSFEFATFFTPSALI